MRKSIFGMLTLMVVVLVGFGFGLRGTGPVEAKKPPKSAAAYVLGKLDGALADQLLEVLQPAKWKGQTDGLLIMAGESVRQLNGENLRNLHELHAAGQPIVLTNAEPEHFHRLHALLGQPVPVTLRQPYDRLDFYAHVHSAFGPKLFAMFPLAAAEPSDTPPSDTAAQKRTRAEEVLDWLEGDVRQSRRTGGQPVPGEQDTGGTVLEPTFRTALVIFTNIGRHKAPCRAAQGGEASADVRR